jgi:ABC-type glycerol-3-phosphate transport system permease component
MSIGIAVTGFIPRPLYELLIYPSYMRKNSKTSKPTDDSFNRAERMVLGACRIAAASLGAYAFCRVNPSGRAGMAIAALGACVLSVPSTVLAAAGYLFYSAATSGKAAYAAPSVKAAAIFAGYLLGGYIVSLKHDLAQVGILDHFIFSPIARMASSPVAKTFAR